MSPGDDDALKAALVRIERDLDRMDRKFDSYLTQHQGKHDVEQASYNSHLLAATESMSRGARHEGVLTQQDTRIETIELWRHELLGSMKLVKLAFGTSILSAISVVVGIVVMLSRNA